MRILLLSHSFNSLTQRLYVELAEGGHQVSVEFDINAAVTREAATLFQPQLVVAPYLRRRIPREVWRERPCLIVHPGPAGERGPSSLDWAILKGERKWGVTLIQAVEELDAGPVWSSESFPLRAATKSSLYRHEVTEAAVSSLNKVLKKLPQRGFKPGPPNASQLGSRLNPLMKQSQRRIDWSTHTSDQILRRIRSGDGFPGVLDSSLDPPAYLYDAHPEATQTGEPGTILAHRQGAVCRATVDGAVWIGHMKSKPPPGKRGLKLPAALVLKDRLEEVPEVPIDPFSEGKAATFRDIWYREQGTVGYLYFPFYNGAMGVDHCRRLLAAYDQVLKRPVKVIVLMGGPDFWSNGMHLNLIEWATSPAQESWRNIVAMDDLTARIITTTEKLVIAALEGNAGAGGVFLALAADLLVAREGVVLNPHYKSMGNLYGSEYWTYLLPRRVGRETARELTENRLPISARRARGMGLIEGVLPPQDFQREVAQLAEEQARDPALKTRLKDKATALRRDQEAKPLEAYRNEELARMRLNFFGFDPSYHVARYNFVYHRPRSRTPPYLARHRRLEWVQPPEVSRFEPVK